MKAFRMVFTCTRCGGEVEKVNIGDPVDGGTATSAIVRCTKVNCRYEFAVHVYLMPLGVFDDDGEDHGTARGFNRHQALGELPCDECNAWKTRKDSDRNYGRSKRAKEGASV